MRTRNCDIRSIACKKDPDAIEHEAREKLHYAKPGEVIYTLPETPQGQAAGAAGK